jgi:flagellar protein FliO/FliZ
MSLFDIIRMLAALAVTLGLGGLALVLARRFAPLEVLRLKTPAERRLALVESLMLDPQRRLVLVRCDGREHLLLLGEGRLLAEVDGAGKGEAA